MTTLTQHTETQPLSARLREATREAHERAENRSFVTDLMGGKLDRAAYLALARQHYAIYTALESAGEQLPADDPARRLLFGELTRGPALAHDLEMLAGPKWTELPVLPATEAYAARLTKVACGGPGYAAHAYTRYLGDLSGGQVVRTMLMRHYDFQPEELTFYSFGVKAKPFKDRYRELLDELSFTPLEATATVAEAVGAFELNTALFDDLSRFTGRS